MRMCAFTVLILTIALAVVGARNLSLEKQVKDSGEAVSFGRWGGLHTEGADSVTVYRRDGKTTYYYHSASRYPDSMLIVRKLP